MTGAVRWFVLAAWCCAASSPLVLANSSAQPPNIVLILVDDQGWTDTAVRMDPRAPQSASDFYQTPNLVTLASQGMRFSNAYSAAPVCSPTRAAIQTGKSPAALQMSGLVTAGVSSNPNFAYEQNQWLTTPIPRTSLPESETTIAEHLRAGRPDFATAHFSDGFAHRDGKFRFKPDWTGQVAPNRPPKSMGVLGPWRELPEFPDHVDLIEIADAEHPFRLATSPARSYLNSSFSETPGSIKREGRPELIVHPADAAQLDIADGARVEIGNPRGEIVLHAKVSQSARRGVVIAEGIWPNSAHERGEGINILVGADQPAPYGGMAVHDTKVWLRAA